MPEKISRKSFIYTTSMGTASILFKPSLPGANSNKSKLKAVAFDAFTVFDPRPIFKTVEQLFPANGKEIIETWRSRQFSYQWLRVCGKKYKNFWDVTSDALDYALAKHAPFHTNKEKDLIMARYQMITAWPDVAPSLKALKELGLSLGILSNMTLKMLNDGIQNAALKAYFDFVISTDQNQTYKPDRNAYQMALEEPKLKKEEILFAPFAGWDMAAAKWFGFPTFWVNRLNDPIERLDAESEGTGRDLNDLMEFVKGVQ
jgi:2-haloacid dehalogenase